MNRFLIIDLNLFCRLHLVLLLLGNFASFGSEDEETGRNDVYQAVREKRSVGQIPLGTSGFPTPVEIDPIPSGNFGHEVIKDFYSL